MFVSSNMDVKPANKIPGFIHTSKENIDALSQCYDLDHGLFMTGLNPSVKEGDVREYFEKWGTITACWVKEISTAMDSLVVAYVRFSADDEADNADWAVPHVIGGTEVKAKRVVSPKMVG